VATHLRAFCAAWGLPWQFVFNEWDASFSASQVGLDQADKTIGTFQSGFIDYVVDPIDRSLIRESIARGRLPVAAPVDPDGWDDLCHCTYKLPRKPDANRLRTRQAAGKAVELGASYSTVFSELGMDFEDEIRQRRADEALAKSQGVLLAASPAPPAAATANETQPQP
jgi:capsid protein